MTQETWLARHPYLRPVADFHLQVALAVASGPISDVCFPKWEDYRKDYQLGIPLLQSPHISINLRSAESAVVFLVDDVASWPTPEKWVRESRDLAATLHRELDAPQRAVAWLLDSDAFTPEHPGLLRYLGWTALARNLRSLLEAFSDWRDEERWLRSYCPACGSPPAMAQLVGIETGRRRLLYCGCCGTRWRFRRIGCPFCLKDDAHRLTILAIEGEKDLRIDYCESCGAYLKTYIGEGNETFFLADWTSLHLDLLADDRGLKRPAASLYQL